MMVHLEAQLPFLQAVKMRPHESQLAPDNSHTIVALGKQMYFDVVVAVAVAVAVVAGVLVAAAHAAVDSRHYCCLP